MTATTTTFSDAITRRSWKRDGKPVDSTHYYGRVREPGKPWKWHKLFTDKRASLNHWNELRRQHEHRASGLYREDVERLKKPITQLADDYHDLLRTAGKDTDHIRISKWMLDRLIELGQWREWNDIGRDSMQKILEALEAEDATASYRNKYIARAKAFVTAFLPDDWAHPLRKVHRIREKGQKRTRARRAASMQELTALLSIDLPPRRFVAYVLAAYNGLRRNEARRLLWSDVELSAEIPYVGIRHKQRPTDDPDYIALHPYVATVLLAWRKLRPAQRVLPSVPDLKTLVKDLKRAKVAFTDAKGRRLDYHALRHTFATNLSRYGCSRATKKKLMRHAAEDVTDAYSHAELAEMFAALERVPGVVGLCPARGNSGGSNAENGEVIYPAWVLGRVFETISPLPRWIKKLNAGLCQVATRHRVARHSGVGKSSIRLGSVRAISCPNGGEPWSVYVQRRPQRYYRFRGLILPRVPRVTSDRIRCESKALVDRLLSRLSLPHPTSAKSGKGAGHG